MPVGEEDDCFDADELEHRSAVGELALRFVVEDDEVPEGVGDGDVVDDGHPGVEVGGEVEVRFAVGSIQAGDDGDCARDGFDEGVLEHPAFAAEEEVAIEGEEGKIAAGKWMLSFISLQLEGVNKLCLAAAIGDQKGQEFVEDKTFVGVADRS